MGETSEFVLKLCGKEEFLLASHPLEQYQVGLNLSVLTIRQPGYTFHVKICAEKLFFHNYDHFFQCIRKCLAKGDVPQFQIVPKSLVIGKSCTLLFK